jgi:hypothetical protein
MAKAPASGGGLDGADDGDGGKNPPDAVLMLGTGMPTLPALAAIDPAAIKVPVLSSNVALVWQALEALQGRWQAPSAATLVALLGDVGWRARLRSWMASGGEDEGQSERSD